jgi:glutathione synthase/RimK-type ligase-like ATP-grasp enzyme
LGNKQKFTFITYADMPDLDPDDRLAVNELHKLGVECNAATWSDDSVDWSKAGICVLRSTWDYHLHHGQFLNWLDQVAQQTTVWNDVSLVRWNMNKKYMLDLQKKSIPVVPTLILTQGSKVNLKEVINERGWRKSVIKPAIGLSTFGVKTISTVDDAAQAYADELLHRGDVLLQPFVESVGTRGERAMVFIGGQYSHAIRKTAFQPLAPVGGAGETVVQVDDNELALANRVLDSLESRPIYARVDVVRNAAGEDLVMELELVEPSLYLSMHPPAALKFAQTLCQSAMQ